jgi:electron transfer flavoprotein alpha subunit
VELTAVLFGHGIAGEADRLIGQGADRVLIADHPGLEHFTDDLYGGLLARLIQAHKPEVVLCGATSMGRSFFPKTARAVDTGLTADCTGLEVRPEDRLLVQTRPAFGGAIMAAILCPQRRPQMATVRPKVMKPLAFDPNRRGEKVMVDVAAENLASRTRVLEAVEEIAENVNLAEAEVIVAGGRGLGKPEGFDLLRRLADRLNGVIGATRGAVDAGWIPYAHQVGQTGKTVAPKLYIACGISGAVQHQVGMQSSDVVVAVNSDPNAPIFDAADYALIGDVYEIVPAMIRRLDAG